MYRWSESERVIMQRYFINQNADENQRFFIEDKGDIHHIANVMRLIKYLCIITRSLSDQRYIPNCYHDQ